MSQEKPYLAKLREQTERNGLALGLKVEVSRVGEGQAEVVLESQGWLINHKLRPERIVAFAVMDLALELACHSLGRPGVLLEEEVSFLKAIERPQRLVAVARMVEKAGRKSSWEVELIGEGGVVVARASAMCYYP